MYKVYYLNLNQQDNGDYEVHDENCSWITNSMYQVLMTLTPEGF